MGLSKAYQEASHKAMLVHVVLGPIDAALWPRAGPMGLSKAHAAQREVEILAAQEASHKSMLVHVVLGPIDVALGLSTSPMV